MQNNNINSINYRGANLTYAKLWDADLSSGCFIDCNFTNAILVKTKLISANLEGADLTNADLTDAYLSEVKINSKTIIDRL